MNEQLHNCKKCESKREDHKRTAQKHKSAAKVATDHKRAAALNKAGEYEEKLAKTAKCANCKKTSAVESKGKCSKCESIKENHRNTAQKHRGAAKVAKDHKRATSLTNSANYEEQLAKTAKCAKCKNSPMNEDASNCAKCEDIKADHLRIAQKHRSVASGAGKDRRKALMLNDSAKYEEKLARNAKCDKCKKASMNENFYAPRNVVANGKPSLGDSTDDTVYQHSDIRDKIYQPSKQETVDNEHNQKASVPQELVKILMTKANDSRNKVERLSVTQSEDKQFYEDLATVFEYLAEFLKSGTEHDLKMASTFLTSLMGPMLYEIPTEVVRFISYGGQHAPLKTFMNSITTPNGGFNVKGELDKL